MSGNAGIWWRQRFSQRATGIAPRIVVVTDLDEAMSEQSMRSVPDARAAVDFLAARGIPLVVNSGRSRAEIERLHDRLKLSAPFISECGSALFLPHGSFPRVPPQARPGVSCDIVEFGRRYRDVVDALRLTCREAAIDVVGFAELSIHEIARELGVTMAEAQLAMLREYTEVFRIVDESDSVRNRLFKALHRRGLRCWPSGAHHMVSAVRDRTESLRTLRAIWGQAWGDPILIGLGGASEDRVWLRHVDVAIIIPSPGAGVPPEVLSKLPRAHLTKSSGLRGWSEAVFERVGSLISANGRRRPLSRTPGRMNAP